MKKPASEQTAMQPIQEPSTTENEVSGDTSTSELKGLPVKVSVLQKFLSVRDRKSGSTPTKLTAESLSNANTKRRHGDKTVAKRAAIRQPTGVFSESVDVYALKKREQEWMNLHQNEREVNEAFLTKTPALSFEREVLYKIVCGREYNRVLFKERLWCSLLNGRGRTEDMQRKLWVPNC
ncbi:hypothetical protein PRIC2_014435 [Phytophthora ramorum]